MSGVIYNKSLRTASFRSVSAKPTPTKCNPFQYQQEVGLDWEVQKEELTFNLMESSGLEQHRAVVRQDNRTAVGIVGKDYHIVQNREIFEFFSDVGEFDLELEFVGGGAIGRGEIVWCMARVPSMQYAVKDTDVLDTYIMLSNGHGGNATLKVDLYTFRQICANGMKAITISRKGHGIEHGWNIKHTSRITDRFAAAKDSVIRIAADHAATINAIESMANVEASFETVEEIASAVWGPIPEFRTGKNQNKGRTIALNRLDDLQNIWNSPTATGYGIENTLWAAVNTVTEWIEHEGIARTGNLSSDENRFLSNYLDGPSSSAKELAYSVALAKI